MAISRQRKEEFVADFKETFEAANLVVVTQQSGLSADDVNALRQKMYDVGATYKVTKNNLAKLALKGTTYEPLEELFQGPTAVAVSDDPIAAAKAAVDFANENEKLRIVGGAMGDKLLSEAEVTQLAKLPSLDELRGKLVGLLQAPASKLARLSQAPAGQLARVFGAYGQTE